MRFQSYGFCCHRKRMDRYRVHTTVLMRFRLSTLKRSKTIVFHVLTYVGETWNQIFSDISSFLRRFGVLSFRLMGVVFIRPFSTVHTNTICFHPLSREVSMKTLSVLLWTEGLNLYILLDGLECRQNTRDEQKYPTTLHIKLKMF